MDIGGSSSMGGGFQDFYSTPNKDAMTVFLAEYYAEHGTIPEEYLQTVSQLDGESMELPNDTMPDVDLLWPTKSGEVTLWYGQIDEQYTAVHKGINIQGAVGDDIYAACDGTISYVGYNSAFGNVVCIDFQNGSTLMQVRYGNLSPSVEQGDSVSAGDVIGTMAAKGSDTKGVLQFVVRMSTDGQACSLDGSNSQTLDPAGLMERPAVNLAFLEEPMATLLDTTGMAIKNTNSKTSMMLIWPWEDENDPDIRYRENLDLGDEDAYLRKIVVEYAKQLNLKVDNKKLEKDGVLTYNNETGIATVVLNGRRVLYGPSLGNAVIKNNRMIVNAEKVWYDLIGRIYGDINSIPEGGTWTPGKYTLELGVYTFRSKTYIPYELARDMVILEKSRTVQSVNTQNLQLMRPGLWRPDDMWPAADRRGSQY